MARNPAADWRGPARNHGGAMSEFRGLVVHIAEGYYEGTISYMLNNPLSASSHFVCGDGALGQGADGALAQMLDTTVVAYTQIAGNGHWISVECAGFTPHPLTAAQVETVAQLLAWCHVTHAVPLQLAFDPTGHGLGHHSMGTNGHDNPTDTWTGPTWGHEDCPGPAIYNQKPAIVARATEIAGGDMASEWHTGDQSGSALTQGPPGVAGQQRDTALGFAWAAAQAASEKADQALAALAELKAMVAALPPGGGSGPTAAEIAKAVNDDAAARLAE